MQPSPGQSYPGQSYPAQSYPGHPTRFGNTGSYPPVAARQLPSAGTSGPAPYAAAPSPSGIYPAYPMQPMQPIYPLPQPVPVPPPLDGRRQALLAVLIYNPVMLAAYLLYVYGPGNSCVAGPFCAFSVLPGLLQGILLLLGAGLLWLLVTTSIVWLLEVTPWHGRFARALRAVTDYALVRPLYAIYGGAMLLGLLVGLITWRLTPAALIIGGVTAFVCLRCAIGGAPAPAATVSPTGGPRTV